MSMVSEYRLQTLGGVILVLLGFSFWIMFGTFLKFNGFITKEGDTMTSLIRQIGILTLLLPVIWAIYTIKKEQDQTSFWTKKHSIISVFPTTFLCYISSPNPLPTIGSLFSKINNDQR